MANIIKNYAEVASSDFEKISTIDRECTEALRADEKGRSRSYRNWKYYFGVDGGQWKDETKAKLNLLNRHANQFNVIAPKVDSMAGALVQEEFDLDWKPDDGEKNSLTESIKTVYYSDKDLCDYEKNVEEVILDGLIYEGILKVGMSDRYNPLKNICFKRCIPGYVVKDPYWISNDDKDLERAWEFFHVHPEEVADIYGVSNEFIDAKIKNLRRQGLSYEQFTRNPDELARLNMKGDFIRLIEFHYIKKISTSRIMGKKLGSPRFLNFPITDDRDRLIKFMEENLIDPMTLREAPYTDRIHNVCTVSPEYSKLKILEKGVSKVQIKRLPYLIFSANRAMGQSKGLVDDMIDVQDTINKRESKLTELISTSQGGGKLVNKDLIKGRVAQQRFKERVNDPSYVEFVEGDELSKEKSIHYINSNQYPSQIVDQIARMYETMDKVSKVPAAMEAMSQHSNESGALFDMKLQVARMNTITIVNRIKSLRKRMAEAYFYQFSLAYNGLERPFTRRDNGDRVVLNQRVFNEEDGKLYIKNRPSEIPRCHVVLTESRSSPNRKIRDRVVYSELYNLSTKTNPEYSPIFFELLIRTLDLDEEQEQKVNEVALLQKVRNRVKAKADISSLVAQMKQSDLAGMQFDLETQKLMAEVFGGGGSPSQVSDSLVAEEQLAKEAPLEEDTVELSGDEELPLDGSEDSVLSADSQTVS